MKSRGKTSTYGHVDYAYQLADEKHFFQGITVGWVVDTNDPQQMGRLRVLCPALGDNEDQQIKDIPWSIFSAPYAGFDDVGSRGPTEEKTQGPVAYGMWGLPKIGAYVLVMCVDGNTNHRVCVGSVPSQWLMHTMPHGRYKVDDEGNSDGPLSSSEEPIQPLYDNLSEAFTNGELDLEPRESYEWRSRGADYQLSSVTGSILGKTVSSVEDDRLNEVTEDDGNNLNITQGYAKSRIQPDLNFPTTDGINFDSQVYSWVTPGFHSISMDDRPENGRIRMRTTAGHQIIMDDTNERIYVSTAEGKCWVELDQNGNIDVFSDRRISFHAKKDINFVSDESFRVSAKNIHFRAEEDIRMHSDMDLVLHSGENTFLSTIGSLQVEVSSSLDLTTNEELNIFATDNINISSENDINVYGNSNLNLTGSSNNVNVYSGNELNLTGSSGNVNVFGGGDVVVQGSAVHLNGLPATQASQAQEANDIDNIIGDNNGYALLANRSPQHEPWSRVMIDMEISEDGGNSTPIESLIPNLNSSILELQYDDPNVGKIEHGETIERNNKWHR